MRRLPFQLLISVAGFLILLLFTATSAFSATPSVREQVSSPGDLPVGADELEQYWQELYPSADPFAAVNENNVYQSELLAKAVPDECFNGIGADESADTVPDCPNGQPKVNEAYVWGMTEYSDTIWFGTAPNVHCLVMGGFLGASSPIATDSYACEFGQGPYSQGSTVPTLPEIIGDWRPPSLYAYDSGAESLTEVTPPDPRLISNTLGIRSAGSIGNYVFFAGPAFSPTASINMFMFNAATQQYLGSRNLPGYSNIRKWLEVDGELYTAVGTPDGGAVLRYTGDPTSPANRFDFVVVGTFDADGAELAFHEGRIFVNTWPNSLSSEVVAGLWMSPVVPADGLPEDSSEWELIFKYDEYEPDPVIARTYGGGALFSYEGDLFWGTMHVPFLATLAHLSVYGDAYGAINESRPDEEDIAAAMLGSQRSIAIFQGRNFGTPDEEIELAYGLPELPAFDPVSLEWYLVPNELDDPEPKYGLSGFGNMYNNYTWSMAEYDGQLFVGTMDWSYLLDDIIQTFLQTPLDSLELPLDIVITLPDATLGADLYRFYSPDEPAVAESLDGVGNYSSYGVRNLVGREDGLYLGMANPMNLLTDLEDDKPEGGWELLQMTRHLIPLTVTVAGNGSGSVVSDPDGIDCGVTCTTSYDFETQVVLTPTADTGSTFTGWSGGCYGPTCSLSLSDSTTVTATFTLDKHPLFVTLAGDGNGSVLSSPAGINCGTACDELYDYGTLVTLTQTVSAGSVFVGWDGACSGTGTTCTVPITDTSRVTATFANNRFPLVINLAGNGSGNVVSAPPGVGCSQPSCSADFDLGAQVSLSAVAFNGSSFDGWSGACKDFDPCQLTIGTMNIVTATFIQNPQQATIHVDGDLKVGSPISLTATLSMNPISECSWDFGDGNMESCAPSVGATGVDAVQDLTIQTSHVYTQSGVYLITVSATNNAGTIFAVQEVSIGVPTAEEPVASPNRPGELYLPYMNR